MMTLSELQTQFIALRNKTREGEIFQSLGETMAEILAGVSPQPVTSVALPVDGEQALIAMRTYSQQLEAAAQEQGTEKLVPVPDETLRLAVAQLANPLPKYRDTGAFFFLSDVIQNQLLSDTQMRWLMTDLVSDEQLFAHIFEANNVAIYRRSFSVLLVSLLLFTQRTKTAFMSDALLDHVINRVALYAALERDARGFIGTNGWAHAFTHIGNAVNELLLMPKLMRADKLFLLASMLAGYRELQQPLVMGETARMTEVALRAAQTHAIYEDYLLLTLKLWRKDLVTRQAPQSEGRWHELYNRTRFFHAILLAERQAVPDAIYHYVEQTKDYLT